MTLRYLRVFERLRFARLWMVVACRKVILMSINFFQRPPSKTLRHCCLQTCYFFQRPTQFGVVDDDSLNTAPAFLYERIEATSYILLDRCLAAGLRAIIEKGINVSSPGVKKRVYFVFSVWGNEVIKSLGPRQL